MAMIIYKTTNLINGKIYIGKACGRNAVSSYLGSGISLQKAIKKYGKESFKKTLIDIAENRKDQERKEIFWIKFYEAKNPVIGYNIADGGAGGNHGKYSNLEYRIKLRNCHLGSKHSNEAKQKMRIAKLGNSNAAGCTHSEETRRRNSIAQTGNKNAAGCVHSKEARQRLSIAMTGKKRGKYNQREAA